MNDIYQYRSASLYLKNYLLTLKTSKSRGAHKDLAQALRIFPSYLSLILSGERTLNLDQGILLAEYLKLKISERRYLLRVIELDRAQSKSLQDEINSELNEIISRESQIVQQVEKMELSLGAEDVAQFFSSWTYSAVHLLAAISQSLTPQSIAKILKLSLEEAKKIYFFLLKTGLWTKKDSKIEIGTSFIHIDQSSNYLNNHYANWRLKAIERHRSMNKDQELAYSLSVALSEK
ncbi:MAG: hypothetical protein Q7U04_01040, partial [Bacteriovorax sp.]|nr:hypothetical protein [Bacteriovorax sp.]